LIVTVDLGGARSDFSLGKITHRVTQGVNIVAKLKIKAR
jgi:hypothetical protein